MLFMDFSKMSIEEMQAISSKQRDTYQAVISKASLMGDIERAEYLNSFSDEQLDIELGVSVLSLSAKQYRYQTAYRMLCIMQHEAGLFEGDLLMLSHLNAIIDRLEILNQELEPSYEW